MVIYIEDVIIENFLVTLLLLLCLNKLFKIKSSKLRLATVSALAGILSTVYPLISVNGILEIVFKLCFGVVIIYIYSGKAKMFAKYLSFIFLTALFGGINILVYYFAYGTMEISDNFPTYVLIFLLFIIYYLLNSCIKLMQKGFVVSNFIYDIEITDNNISLKDKAFLDSGNTLLDEEGSPVFIINIILFNKLYKNIKIEDLLIKNYQNLKDPHYIKSGYATGGGKILVFSVDKLKIFSSNSNMDIKNAKIGVVYSSFDKNFNCNMLLNINAFAFN